MLHHMLGIFDATKRALAFTSALVMAIHTDRSYMDNDGRSQRDHLNICIQDCGHQLIVARSSCRLKAERCCVR